MATLFKRKGSPFYYVLYGDHIKSTGTSDRKLAQDVLKQF